ncbi:MAG: hypothetical protein RMM08_08145, partial [Armatimonadota bacterium]|nr:hypothetical protein [Armatimonadota bacterium]
TVEVWEKPHFEGQSAKFTSSVADLRAVGWDKRISSVRVAPVVERSEGSEREAILAALRDAIKRFPDEDPLGLGFRYQRPDVRLPAGLEITLRVHHLGVQDGWAWVEAEGEDYVLEIAALLRKESGQWKVRGIVNPAYVVCPDEATCLDVLAFLYRSFQAKAPQVPQQIFPEVHPEREAVLRAVRGIIPVEGAVLLVREFVMQSDRIRVTVHPRTPDGRGQFEPVTAVLQKDAKGWSVAETHSGHEEDNE